MTESIFLDANLLISLKEKQSVFYNKALGIIEWIVKTNCVGVINSYVVNEVHYFYTRASSKSDASAIVKSLFDIPNIKYNDIIFDKDDLYKILKFSEKYNLKTFDAYHAYYCKKLGIKKIATFDKDFEKIKWLKVVGG